MRAMGKVEIRIPLVTWRDGRPRFSPGPAVRALGYAGEDLRHGKAGAWFTLDEAIRWSRTREAEIEARRAAIRSGATTARRLSNAARREKHSYFTVGQLVETFLASPRMAGREIVEGRKRRLPLAANTVRAYKGSARLIERFDEGRVWNEAAGAVTGKALAGILDRVEVLHGLAQARALRAFLSVAWRHGRKAGVVHNNPVGDIEETLPVPQERLRPASVAEIEHMIAVADAIGWADMGDAIAMGAWTGQRQNDRQAVAAAALSADGLTFQPSKKRRTGERLLIPLSAVLEARLRAAKVRRMEWPAKPLTLLACPLTRRPWGEDFYRKVFRIVRHAAATGDAEREKDGALSKDARTILGKVDVPAALRQAGLEPMPSVADLRDQDLRDTAVTWLGLAGADKWEIAGFTGHAFGKEDKVLKHYLAVPPEFARRGMAKLEAWHAAELGRLQAAAR